MCINHWLLKAFTCTRVRSTKHNVDAEFRMHVTFFKEVNS